MVDFRLDEETRLVLDSFETFLDTEVVPIEEALGETFSNPRKRRRDDGRPVEEVIEAVREIRQLSADAGFYAMTMPTEVGGEEMSLVTWYEAKKAAAAHESELAGWALSGPEGPKPLLLSADADQRERYVEPVVRGEKSTAFAQTEPGAGSDSPNMTTTARRDGDEWVIDGTKQWITNAPFCDFAQVFARTTPVEDAGRYGGITCFIVERDEFELGAINNAIGVGGWQAEIRLNDVRIPANRVLGDIDNAFYDAMEFLSLGRLELGAEAVGHAQKLLAAGFEHAKGREAFGRSIGSFQQVSSKLARGRANAYAADAAGLRCAWRMANDEDVVEDTSMFKWFATNALWEIADDVVQVHGATGVAEDADFARLMERARVLRVVEGTDEIQLNTIARQNGL